MRAFAKFYREIWRGSLAEGDWFERFLAWLSVICLHVAALLAVLFILVGLGNL